MAQVRYANEFQHASERAAAQELAAALPAQAIAIANYVLPDEYGGGEIDFVVVLAEGIACLEVKNWYGRIDRVGAFVEFANGYSVRAPFDGLKYKHKRLRSLLLDRGLITEQLAVGSALVTSGRLEWPSQAIIDRHVLSIADLRAKGALLRSLQRHDRGVRLEPRAVKCVADELKESSSGTDRWRVAAFVLDEEIASTEFARTYTGRAAEVVEREVILRCWELDPLEREGTRARILRQVRKEAGALASLERARCPAIPIVYDAFIDPGDFNMFWLAHETVGRRTLADAVHQLWAEPELPAAVLAQLDTALQVLREHKIVHRAIRPEVIFLGDDGRVLLSGFELSAAEDGTVRRTEVVARSPEERTGSHQTGKTDLYNVARMVLDWLCRDDAPVKKKLATLKRGPLQAALAHLLQEDPARRPDDLAALVKSLSVGLPR